jgi:murein hydrolase activator
MPTLSSIFYLRIGLRLLLGLTVMGSLMASLQGQETWSWEELEARIELSERLLRETRDQEEQTLHALRMLNQQIELRQSLLLHLSEATYDQAAAVEKLEWLLCEMEADIEQIRQNYLHTARSTYRHLGTDNFWLTLLSAEGLSNAFYRMQYFQRFASYRAEQMELIAATRKELLQKKQQLIIELAESEALMAHRQQQVAALEADRQRQRALSQSLKQQARQYQRQLAAERRRLQSLIQESEEVYASTVQPVADSYGLTFPAQRGRLPWPLPREQALVVEHFGRSEDPYGNIVINDGIYLRTPAGQQVYAIYAGRVTAVTEIPMNGGVVVIVEHGRYRSVYANLEKAFVQEGQLLAMGQPLGLVRTDRRSGETVLQFLIYALPNRFVDPEQWLR